MNSQKLTKLFGDYLPEITFTGGCAVSLFCEIEGDFLRRRTNDYDLVTSNPRTGKAIEDLILTLEGSSAAPENRISNIKHYQVGNDHVDILDESINFLPSMHIRISGIETNIQRPSNTAGAKLSRLVKGMFDTRGELRTHDILDTAIFNNIFARKSPAEYQRFLDETSLIFMIRGTSSDFSAEELINNISSFRHHEQKLRDMLPTDDPESPLYYFKDKAFDNTIREFLSFCDHMHTALTSRTIFSDVSATLSNRCLSQFNKENQIKDILSSDSLGQGMDVNDFVQRVFRNPHVERFHSGLNY